MRPDPKSLFRGLGKFVAVAVIAALVGAGIGVGLAALTGGDDSPAPTATTPIAVAPPAQSQTQTQPAAPPPAPQTATQTETTAPAPTTTTATKFSGPVPKITIASATLGTPSGSGGTALATVRLTVTNRYTKALPLETPAVISGDDRVPLHSDAKDAAGDLLGTLAAGASASGVLRFTLPRAVARRLAASPTAKLRIAGRTVTLKLTPTG